MEETMDYPHFEPCPACGAKKSTVTKDRPCQSCGCTVDDPYGILSGAEHSGAVRIDFDQLHLSLCDDGDSEAPPPATEWTVDEFRELSKKKKLARAYAKRSSEALLYDELGCADCSEKRLQSRPLDGGAIWRLTCVACGHPVASDELIGALVQIDKFAAFERQFLRVNPLEAMALLSRALNDKAVKELRSDGEMVEVFPEKQLSALLDNSAIQSGDGDEKSRVRQTAKRLMESSGFRSIAVPGPAWQSQIDELREHFPNFASAISDVVSPSMAIAAAGGRARPAPLLLIGPPGVGKSQFAEALSKILAIPRVKIDMASATMGASIGGVCTHWGNAGPGEVFKVLAFGRGGMKAVANPLVFLDEIDKVRKGMRYDPLAPLYSLLEIESAKVFEDEFLPGLEIDASHIRWIMCANAADPIPAPIISRVHAVHVREPTENELIHIRARIFHGVVMNLGIADFEKWIPDSVLHGAGNAGPRQFKTACVMAIGKALTCGKYRVSENDFASGLSTPVRKLGFM